MSNSVSFKSKCFVNFCELRNDPEAVNKIIKENHESGCKGVSNEEQLLKFLKSEDYFSVQKCVWGEHDRPTCLNWLRKMEDASYPFLLLEQSIVEYEVNPTIETIQKVSIPLLFSAASRITQDATCHRDLSVSDAGFNLYDTYHCSLKNIVKKYQQFKLDAIPNDEQAVSEKLFQIMQRSLEISLPSPKWLSGFGLSAFVGGGGFFPETTWKEKRDAFAKNELSQTR